MWFVVAARPLAGSRGSAFVCARVLLLCGAMLLRDVLVCSVERNRCHCCCVPWCWGSHRAACVSEGCLLLDRKASLGWRHGVVLWRGCSTLLRVGLPLLSCWRVECSPLLSTLLCRVLLCVFGRAVPGLMSLLPTCVAFCASLPLLATLLRLISHGKLVWALFCLVAVLSACVALCNPKALDLVGARSCWSGSMALHFPCCFESSPRRCGECYRCDRALRQLSHRVGVHCCSKTICA